MRAPLGTAGGFGNPDLFTRDPPTYVLAPDAGPKLALMVVLAVLVALWIRDRARATRR